MTTRESRTKARKKPIPEFKSREDEAKFWDTHSAADYWDESEPVKVRFARNLSEGITIRLDPDTMREVREQAKQNGLGPTTLIRMWVLERLQGVRPTTR
jgi:predicted DNA binding CopG/RHH family protein